MVRSCERIIRRGDELCIYNCGVHGAHTGPKIKDVVRKHRTAVGLLTPRRDGFVSLDAGDEPGYILTKTFPWPGGDLHLNVDATHGAVRTALCDEAAHPFPALEASHPISGDHLDATVRWPDESLLPERAAPVKLRVSLRRGEAALLVVLEIGPFGRCPRLRQRPVEAGCGCGVPRSLDKPDARGQDAEGVKLTRTSNEQDRPGGALYREECRAALPESM